MIGIAYLVGVDRNGDYQKSQYITEMPAFPDLYREVNGKLPSGPDWDALNWLTSQIGEMTYVGFAPPGTPPATVAALRKGFEGASNDPEFVAGLDQAQRRAVHLCQRRARAGDLPLARRRDARGPGHAQGRDRGAELSSARRGRGPA